MTCNHDKCVNTDTKHRISSNASKGSIDESLECSMKIIDQHIEYFDEDNTPGDIFITFLHTDVGTQEMSSTEYMYDNLDPYFEIPKFKVKQKNYPGNFNCLLIKERSKGIIYWAFY